MAAVDAGPGPVWAIVLAAGQATRYGGPKMVVTLAGHRVLDWAVAAARAACDGVVVVAPPSGEGPAPGRGETVVAGGPTRSASVRAGLAAVPPEAEIVLVHDGARALASPALFRRVIDVVAGGRPAVAPALPLRDALKRVTGATVVESVDRDDLVAVQTPQGFAAGVLRAAHAADPDAIDDLELVERHGHVPVVIAGEEQARKLTVPEDLVALEAFVARLCGWADEERP